jgi:ADP-heptose:LPS heptosyltransferase
MNVLIIKLGALGDVINTLPLATALKDQLGARIHWLVEPLSHPLLAVHEAVDHAILFDRKKGLRAMAGILGELKSHSFDLVIDLQRILKSGIISRAVRGRRTIGFDWRRCKELTWLLPFERIPPADPQRHMVHQYLDFAAYLGIKEVKVEWRIPDSRTKPADLPEEFVVLNIGATKKVNRWTSAGFAALARMIHTRYGFQCLLTGGREDVPMAQSIIAAAGDAVCDKVGRTSLMELVSLLSAARAVVTCDTGPMHLAVALGKPVVALFGPSDHRRTGPYRGKVIRAKIDCGPCGRKKCKNPICMTAIRAREVMKVLEAYL